MMGGNPNYWWGMYPPSSLFFPNHLLGSSSSAAASFSSSPSLPSNGFADNQEPPESLNLLLLGGLSAVDEERTTCPSHFQPDMLENLEDRLLNPSTSLPVDDIKYDVFRTGNHYSFELPILGASFSQTKPASSPSSCVISGVSNNTILDFSYNNVDRKNRLSHGSSECNSTANVGSGKKARVQSSSTQPPLKVRKEKLGDRITALHQLVSPFGKTDTASVLMEAIGYIRFLHGQIEALSSPYLRNASKTVRNKHFVQAEGHSVFPEDPGQLLNDTCLRRKMAPHQEDGFIKGNQEKARDLRSRGLCLAPVSCTQYVGTGSENGADHWAQGYGGGF